MLREEEAFPHEALLGFFSHIKDLLNPAYMTKSYSGTKSYEGITTQWLRTRHVILRGLVKAQRESYEKNSVSGQL